MRADVSALYVRADGPYPALVADWWDETRDARLYAGPNRVVAHPPCARWGRYWFGGPSARERREMGDDQGCFSSALAAVDRWGGVLEHPEGSHAWLRHGLCLPPKSGGWVSAGWGKGWTCCVEQVHYGHPARKATWLYAVGTDTPPLRWGPGVGTARLDQGYHTAAERRLKARSGPKVERLSHRQRELTPEPFARLLVDLAASAVV